MLHLLKRIARNGAHCNSGNGAVKSANRKTAVWHSLTRRSTSQIHVSLYSCCGADLTECRLITASTTAGHFPEDPQHHMCHVKGEMLRMVVHQRRRRDIALQPPP